MVSIALNILYKTCEIQSLEYLCSSEDTESTGSEKCSGNFGDFLFVVL